MKKVSLIFLIISLALNIYAMFQNRKAAKYSREERDNRNNKSKYR